MTMSLPTLNPDATKVGLAPADRASSPEAIQKAARQFESLFIQMMLKSMRQAELTSSSLLDNSKTSQYRDMYDTELAKTLAQGKGMGLADLIARQVSQQTSTSAAAVSAQLKPPHMANSPATFVSTGRLEPYVRPAVSGVSAVAAEQLATLFGDDAVPASPALTAPVTDHPAQQQTWRSPAEFVSVLWPHAQRAAQRINADPRALIAQAALETGWGQHVMRGADGRSSYNFFGIKADQRWDGGKVTVPTLEFEQGAMRRRVASFRAYDSVAQSFDDYVNFLQSNPRYTEALQAASNPHQYLRELQAAGYATDPHYANKIQGVINSEAFRDHAAGLKKNPVMPLTSEKAPVSVEAKVLPSVSIST
jgi:peptidoglycan hydrolase FlgJ